MRMHSSLRLIVQNMTVALLLVISSTFGYLSYLISVDVGLEQSVQQRFSPTFQASYSGIFSIHSIKLCTFLMFATGQNNSARRHPLCGGQDWEINLLFSLDLTLGNVYQFSSLRRITGSTIVRRDVMGDISFSGGFETMAAGKDTEGWAELVRSSAWVSQMPFNVSLQLRTGTAFVSGQSQIMLLSYLCTDGAHSSRADSLDKRFTCLNAAPWPSCHLSAGAFACK